MDKRGMGMAREDEDMPSGLAEPLDRRRRGDSGEAAPAMFGGSIVQKLPEPVQEFLTTPAPSSLVAMTAVTAGGAVGSHLLGTYAAVRPANRAILGAALVLGGHYLGKSWEAKSLGYGALAEGVAQLILEKVRARSAAPAANQAAPQGAIVGGLRNEPLPGSGPIVDEGTLLRQVEEGTVTLPSAASGDVAAAVPSSDEAARDPLAMSAFLRDLSKQRRTKIPANALVQTAGGRLLPIGEYLREFAGTVEGARQQGLMRRSRRVRQDLPMQSEYEFIRGLINRCLVRMADMAEGRLPAEGARLRGVDAFLRGIPENDIAMFDGTTRPATAYATEYPERIEWANARCLAASPAPRAAEPGAAPPAQGGPAAENGTLIQITEERVAPLPSITEVRPASVMSATAAAVSQNKLAAVGNLRNESLTVRQPPFRR
jgi:hypothetical protein